MASSDLEVVRALYERFRTDDPEPVLEFLSEDFVGTVPPSMSAEPDVYRGHAGALRYLTAFEGSIDDVRFVPDEFIEEGEHVIVTLRLEGRGSTSGIEVELFAAVVNRVENGKVKRIDAFPDLDAARAALGTSEEDSPS